jgi:hypothetical protein
MLNWNPLWPMASDEGHQGKVGATPFSGDGALWGPSTFLEYQTYFWTQVIDANRNFWSMFAAAFPGIPAAAAAAVKAEASEPVIEPAAATHAVKDLESVLESQTRFWNHLLDANRNMWSGVTWNLPDLPVASLATVATSAPRRTPSPAAKRSSPARKAAPAKKAQRKH